RRPTTPATTPPATPPTLVAAAKRLSPYCACCCGERRPAAFVQQSMRALCQTRRRLQETMRTQTQLLSPTDWRRWERSGPPGRSMPGASAFLRRRPPDLLRLPGGQAIRSPSATGGQSLHASLPAPCARITRNALPYHG